MRVLLLVSLTIFQSCSLASTSEPQAPDSRYVEAQSWSTSASIAGNLEVAMIDVGQGDCGVVKLPNGQSMVVDCGSSGGLGLTADQIRAKIKAVTGNQNGVDVLVLTHADKDHYNLIPEVFSAASGFGAGAVYIVGQIGDYSQNGTAAWLHTQVVQQLQVNTHQPYPFPLLQGGGATVTVLAAGVGATTNDGSAVLLVEHGGFEALLAADATGATNTFLQSNHAPIFLSGVNVFKVEHHGADTHGSNSAWFVGGIHPDVSVASCGKHLGFGHPRLSVIQLCEQYAMPVPAHSIETYDPVQGWQVKTSAKAVYSTYSSDDFRVWTNSTGSQFSFGTGPI